MPFRIRLIIHKDISTFNLASQLARAAAIRHKTMATVSRVFGTWMVTYFVPFEERETDSQGNRTKLLIKPHLRN